MAFPEVDLMNKRRRPAMAVSPPPSRSAMSLVKALVSLTQLVATCERPKVCQRRSAANIARRIKFLAPLFEEIRDARPPLPPSAIIAFRELHITMQRTKMLLDDLREGSVLWFLVDSDAVAEQFQSLNQELASGLDHIPLELLELSDEVREQVELLRKQVRRAKIYVDESEAVLKQEVLQFLNVIERKEVPDIGQLRTLHTKLKILNLKDYEKELLQLVEELSWAGNNGESVECISSLLGFARYCKCVLFGVCDVEEGDDSSSSSDGGEVSTSVINTSALNAAAQNPPDEFKCPISLDLMRDPVIVATGQTYDRSSIERWLEAGHSTCPKSGQKLLHVSLIPNYALRSLISQWCEDHHLPFEKPDKGSKHGAGVDHIATTRAALEATKMTAAFLVGKLATGSPEVQKQVAYELRLLAKCGMDNRMCIAEAGAVPFLVPLLSSKDWKTQENAVTALLNLSIYDNNKTLIMAAGALDLIVDVLRFGNSMEARENAAATLFSLSVLDEYKITIGNKPTAIPALVELLRAGTSRGKKDAATALFNLSVYQGNKPRLVAAGAIPVLVSLLSDEWEAITDDALAVLALVAASAEGITAISETAAIPVLVSLLQSGSARGKENAIAVLLALCRGGGDHVIASVLKLSSAIPSLYNLLSSGSARANRKATSLLKLLHRWEPSRNSPSPLRQ